MTILVTGSAGHLGEALVRTLRAAGRAVRGLDRLASPTTDVVGSSATTPLCRDDAAELRRDAPAAVRRGVPGWEPVYARLGWRMAAAIDRVYDNARARADLGWTPRHDFAAGVARAAEGEIRSPLARAIGAKGYHSR